MDIGLSGGFKGPPALTERFEILELLGDGAAGFVYRVRDRERSNQVVALKVLADELAFDEATIDRFLQEIRLCQAIRHPNLVQAYDLIEMGDCVAYTMELVDGGSLQKVFSQRRVGYEAIEKIIDQVLRALAELHAKGVVHRDVKMENVLLSRDGSVKLTDLGLMKQLGSSGITKPGLLLGTPQYMPPEYVKRGVYDERGDIYTVGLLLYELCSGKRWLSHLRGQEVINYLVKTRFEINRASLAGVPRKYVEILSRALEQDPTKRFQSAEEMRLSFDESPVEPDDPSRAPSLEIRPGLSLERYSALAQSTAVERSSVRKYLAPLALFAGISLGIIGSALIMANRQAVASQPPTEQVPVEQAAVDAGAAQSTSSVIPPMIVEDAKKAKKKEPELQRSTVHNQ